MDFLELIVEPRIFATGIAALLVWFTLRMYGQTQKKVDTLEQFCRLELWKLCQENQEVVRECTHALQAVNDELQSKRKDHAA